jgi:hypothetical protein
MDLRRSHWTQLNPPVPPPARYRAGMTFDAALQKTVMFGGYSDTGHFMGDT